MEGLRNVVRRSSSSSGDTSSSPVETSNASGGGGATETVAASSSLLLATRPPRQSVSLLTCSKLCAICFVAGVVFGYTLKRRVRRWASKILKYLKE